MKQKPFLVLMGAVFAALTALILFAQGEQNFTDSLLAFPFEQLGAGLRALSLSGKWGNGFALAICVAVSLLPVLLALRHIREKAFLGENLVLFFLGGTLFVTLFIIANPATLLSSFYYETGEYMPFAKSLIGCTVWSLVVLWLALRLVRLFKAGDTGKLLGYLRISLFALCLLFASVIPLSCTRTLLTNLAAAQQGLDTFMAVLCFVASSLPYVLDIAITLSLLRLLDAFIAKSEEDTVKFASSLSRRCCLALGLTAFISAALNVISLLLSRGLSIVSVNLNIPIVSLVFILLILLLSRLITENRKLQNDNDLFI